MLASGVEAWRAKTMYSAVYHFGPRWPRQITVHNLPRAQASKALDIALKDAQPGSTAQIKEVDTHFHVFGIYKDRAATADVEVEVLPPRQTMSEDDFERLKELIFQRETSDTVGFSLQEIRTYKPGL